MISRLSLRALTLGALLLTSTTPALAAPCGTGPFETWLEDFKGVRDVLSEAKEKKIVRAHGVSCHSIEALRAAARVGVAASDRGEFKELEISKTCKLT